MIIGAFTAIMGLIGLFLAAGALDAGMYMFGLGLASFSAFFISFIVKRHCDALYGAKVTEPMVAPSA